MASRRNHYERAFEGFLRRLHVGSMPSRESRRAVLAPDDPASIKNIDFVVTPSHGHVLLVDVKGRRLLPGRRTLENWATDDDIESMGRWEEAFGAVARALLVYVYELPTEQEGRWFHDCFRSDERHYGCLAVALDDYRRHMRVRSPRWRTVCLPSGAFADVARPFSHWL